MPFESEVKRQAVMALCTRQVSASEIARRIGVSRAVLYKWKDEIIGNSAYQTMRKHNEPSLEAERDALREEVARLNQEIRYRQMELDILKKAEQPNQKWLTDITEFHLPAGKVWLSPVVDCFDGKVVSWSLSTRPDAELVNTMLDSAVETLNAGERPVIHSDRGGHYRWPGWLERVNAAGLIRSMSRK